MIRTMIAYTSEMDDVETAVSEILSQLDIENRLLTNSIGILCCYSDFIGSGVVSELSRALPFEVVGSTTLGCASLGSSSGMMMLNLMVLSSDDVSFSTGLTGQILSEDDDPLRTAYEDAASKLPGKPSFMMSFAPLLMNISGDFYTDSFSEISGGVPNFGMISVDNNIDYRDSMVICNDQAYRDRCAILLFSGNVSPRFFMGSLLVEKAFLEKGAVTASHGNQLQTINGKQAVDYLHSLGLAKDEDGTIKGINSFPFMVNFNDGTQPVVRAIFANTPEGYAVCGGKVPVGSIISVCTINAEDIIETTTEVLLSILGQEEQPGCAIVFSCVGRYFYLDYNQMAEIDKAREILGEKGIPYIFAYSGGEFCPVHAADGKGQITNRNHNITCVICVL